jgi:hypothetical protein
VSQTVGLGQVLPYPQVSAVGDNPRQAETAACPVNTRRNSAALSRRAPGCRACIRAGLQLTREMLANRSWRRSEWPPGRAGTAWRWQARLRNSEPADAEPLAGAGKSTFSRALSTRTGLPVIVLDACFWLPGWTEPAEAEWRDKQRRLLAGEDWIADGNYGIATSVTIRLPVAVSQILAVPSLEAVASKRPLGEDAALLTR